MTTDNTPTKTYPHIDAATRFGSASCLLVVEHRYGYGTMAAVVPCHLLGFVEGLATNPGNDPSEFASCVDKTSLPVAFGNGLDGALRALDTKLSAAAAADADWNWDVLRELTEEPTGLDMPYSWALDADWTLRYEAALAAWNAPA